MLKRTAAVGQRHEPEDHAPLFGITLKILSVVIFVAMSSCIKAAGNVPSGQIVFYRSLFAVVPILAMLAWQGQMRSAVKTSRPIGHIFRGAVGVCAMGCTFFGLTRLPLPEAITLNYAQPLLVVVFSALFLGEVVRAYRWAAVVIGLVGVIIISWPNLTLFSDGAALDGQALGALAAIAGAAFSAVAMLLVRSLVHTEHSGTIVMWFSLTASVMALASLPFGWAELSTLQLVYLIASGLLGGVAQILMTESYRHAEASTVAPFEYTSMILAVAIGFVVFGDVPTIHMLVGGLIVVAAGIFIIYRERKLGLERGAARRITLPGS